MADTTFTSGTLITSSWLNDINDDTHSSGRVNVKLSEYGAIGDGASHPLSAFFATLGEAQARYPHALSLTDELDGIAIQAAINAGHIAYLPAGIYLSSYEITVSVDGTGVVGKSAFWKLRTAYQYTVTKQSVIKYVGAIVANSTVVRVSKKAVGVVGTDFSGPDTDDIKDITLSDFHADANGRAEFGVYVYRAGYQTTIGNITAAKAIRANHVHLGCYGAQLGSFGAFEAVGEGVVCGSDIFGWAAVEATCFAYSAKFVTSNNGTGNTYVRGSATDRDNSGGTFSVGRGSYVSIISEGNFGRSCVLSQYNIGGGAAGPSTYFLDYLEANKDGPDVIYRDAMDSIRLICGYMHPGNGSTLLPQDIKITSTTTAGVVTPNSGPTDPGEWLVIEGATGDRSGVGFDINSNTYKYVVRGCNRKLTFSGTFPGIDDYIPTQNQIGAAVTFTASATPTVFNSTNGVLTRTGVGTYLFTFTRAFNASVQITPVITVSTSATLDTHVRNISLSDLSCTIRTYNAAGAATDTGDRISAIFTGTLAYVPL
jgi:hypothetical protein